MLAAHGAGAAAAFGCAILIILEEGDVAVVEMHQRSNGVLVVCDGDDAAIALAKAATKHSVTAGRTGAMVYLKA